MARPPAGVTPEHRFWKNVKKTPTCWLWTGGKTKKTRPGMVIYGTFKIGIKATPTHRFSYELHRGPIPDGLKVCHTCDVGICVNPDHLFVGTQKQNMEDCSKKGRGRSKTHMTEQDVREIRNELHSTESWSKRFRRTPREIQPLIGGI